MSGQKGQQWAAYGAVAAAAVATVFTAGAAAPLLAAAAGAVVGSAAGSIQDQRNATADEERHDKFNTAAANQKALDLEKGQLATAMYSRSTTTPDSQYASILKARKPEENSGTYIGAVGSGTGTLATMMGSSSTVTAKPQGT